MTSYILFFSGASKVFLIPFSNFNDKKQTSITKNEGHFEIMLMFNLMTKKKVN